MNEQNKTLKNSKGITLVALIITIVVLLILAAVAIGAAQESNIVGYAQNAATKYEEAKNNELSLLSKYETELDKYATNKESATGGVKAYDFYGSIMIFTPENELYQYVKATDFFPSYKIDLIEVKIENDPTYDITINTNDFTQEEISKMHLVTATEMGGICAYFDGENGRDTFYWNPITAGSTEVTITKSIPIQHSEQLLAQYYHETTSGQYYFGAGEGNEGTVCMVNNVEEDKFIMINIATSGTLINLLKKSSCEIEQNKTAFEVQLDGQKYIIREGAKKITLEDYVCYYIQDNLFIYGSLNYGITEGVEIQSNRNTFTLVKLFNSSILEIE